MRVSDIVGTVSERNALIPAHPLKIQYAVGADARDRRIASYTKALKNAPARSALRYVLFSEIHRVIIIADGNAERQNISLAYQLCRGMVI